MHVCRGIPKFYWPYCLTGLLTGSKNLCKRIRIFCDSIMFNPHLFKCMQKAKMWNKRF